MSRRRFHTPLIAAVALAAALAIPTVALAGTDVVPDTSAVDQVASDVATDGVVDTSAAETTAAAADSPTTSAYSGGGDSDELPPPVDCTDVSASDPSSCEPVVEECADKAGTDSSGEPCTPPVAECADPTGNDSKGEPCTPTVDVGDCDTAGGGAGGTSGTVCGGGGTPEDPDVPVDGGGNSPSTTPNTAAGGGGPELPFTGLPLWWTILAAGGLMTVGGGIWMLLRGRHEGA